MSLAQPKIGKIRGGKKRKVPESISRKDEPKSTTTGHYLKFINDTLNIVDKYENLKGFILLPIKCTLCVPIEQL